jgi:thiamine-monophosphate kinase
VADLGHICEVSGVSALVDKEKIPISAAARGILKTRPELWNSVFSGGDDYELLFTVPPAKEKMLNKINGIAGIGRIVKKSANPLIILEKTREIPLNTPGYKHF